MVAAKRAYPNDRDLQLVIMHIYDSLRCGRRGEVAEAESGVRKDSCPG